MSHAQFLCLFKCGQKRQSFFGQFNLIFYTINFDLLAAAVSPSEGLYESLLIYPCG